MKLKLEEWTAVASLVLSAMFVTLLLSFYNFLIGPEGKGPDRVVDPGSLILQLIFISAAPCVVLAGFVFGMAKSYGTRIGGMLLIASGIIMIAGMVAGIPILARIPGQYVVGVVGVAPYFFMAAGAGITAVGGYLIAATKRRPISSDLDDLR
ncbi:MAG TPA: hypothetical protein VJ730_06820 [Nitrososphaera sp.]|jgi:hypothetical protein|nr:hypothetical protein [Nitrososphaera sp.]